MKIDNLNDLITDRGMLTIIGMYAMHDYYTSFGKIINRTYILHHPQDLQVILLLNQNNPRYNVILKNEDILDSALKNPNNHKTPLVFQNLECFILDSLGNADEVPYIKSYLKSAPLKRDTVVNPSHQRQSDYISCGSEAFLVIKQAEKIDLAAFYNNHSESALPGPIAKYTQSISRLKSPYKKGANGLLDRYSILNTERFKAKGNQNENVMEYVERHKAPNGKFNLAVTDRVTKHKKILSSYRDKPNTQLVKIAETATGLAEMEKADIHIFDPMFSTRLQKEELYKAIEIIKVLKSKYGEFTFSNYALFKDEKECKKLLEKTKKKYSDCRQKFLEGDYRVTLTILITLKYGMNFLQENIDALNPKVKSKLDTTKPHKLPSYVETTPEIGSLLIFPQIKDSESEKVVGSNLEI